MKTTLLLSCAILGIGAYKFDDPFYNQLLLDDFEASVNERTTLHSRVRRDDKSAKCDNGYHLCCGEEQIKAIHNEVRPIKMQCFKELTGVDAFHGKPFDPFNCDDIEKRKKEMICVRQCEGQKTGYADKNGDLKEDDVRKVLIEKNNLEWIKPKLDGMITKCFGEAREATRNMDKSDKDACNPAALKFTHCLFREVQVACPANKIEDPKRCEIIRQFATHSTFYLPHTPY